RPPSPLALPDALPICHELPARRAQVLAEQEAHQAQQRAEEQSDRPRHELPPVAVGEHGVQGGGPALARGLAHALASDTATVAARSEEHTSELQSRENL